MSGSWRFAPLAVLLVVVGAMIWRLSAPDDTVIRSQMVGRQLPEIALAPMEAGARPVALRAETDGPILVNFFASWCVPCIAEAPVLDLLKGHGAQIVGVAVRDRPEDVAAFLGKNGNPYLRIGGDPESKIQLALGSSGVPETFIVDSRGIIRYQHVGPIETGDVSTILDRLRSAR